jgi:tRNA-splicing ligase RtcB
MLHSGSRNIGNMIGQCAMHMAKEVADRVDRSLPHRDLAWLDEGTREFEAYVEGLGWAQEYASLNRDLMLHLVHKALAKSLGRDVGFVGEVTNCHHNYARVEEHFGESIWVTRKGAVSARAGELGIIPGSMGAKSFIVRGKGEASSYCSCSGGRRPSTRDEQRGTRDNRIGNSPGILARLPGANLIMVDIVILRRARLSAVGIPWHIIGRDHHRAVGLDAGEDYRTYRDHVVVLYVRFDSKRSNSFSTTA